MGETKFEVFFTVFRSAQGHFTSTDPVARFDLSSNADNFDIQFFWISQFKEFLIFEIRA